jgi:recombinational DNA repair ATPase RecF
MRVDEIKIFSYKTIVSEQRLDVDPKITVLMGGNETGKTNVLQAINKFSLGNNFETEDISRSSKRYRKSTLPNVGIVFSASREEQQKLAAISPVFQDSNKIVLSENRVTLCFLGIFLRELNSLAIRVVWCSCSSV